MQSLNSPHYPEPFATGGPTKMLYDLRMGPVGLRHKDRIYIAWQANRCNPYIRSYDLQSGRWSKITQAGETERRDTHYAPVIWFDHDNRLHLLYRCHNKRGIHRIAFRTENITEWRDGPTIGENMNYPRVCRMADKRLLLYDRTEGHLGYWGYRISTDGGFSWSDKQCLVDLDQNAATDEERRAGSYHSVAPGTDRQSLHIGFVHKRENVVYSMRYANANKKYHRHHLYYIRLDLNSGRVFNIAGETVTTPLTLSQIECCKVWDTGDRFSEVPSIIVDKNNSPSFILPKTGEKSLYDCGFYYIRQNNGQWRRNLITKTNHIRSASTIRYKNDGSLSAYLVIGRGSAENFSNGGGEVQEWESEDNGETWKMQRLLVPVKGLLYNHPRFIERADGTPEPDSLALYGWQPAGGEGDSNINDAQAFLWRNGKWL